MPAIGGRWHLAQAFGVWLASLRLPQALASLESRRKDVQVRTQSLQQQRTQRSKAIGKAKSAGEDIEPLRVEVAHLGDELKASEAELADIQQELEDILTSLPNLAHTLSRALVSLDQLLHHLSTWRSHMRSDLT